MRHENIRRKNEREWKEPARFNSFTASNPWFCILQSDLMMGQHRENGAHVKAGFSLQGRLREIIRSRPVTEPLLWIPGINPFALFLRMVTDGSSHPSFGPNNSHKSPKAGKNESNVHSTGVYHLHEISMKLGRSKWCTTLLSPIFLKQSNNDWSNNFKSNFRNPWFRKSL